MCVFIKDFHYNNKLASSLLQQIVIKSWKFETLRDLWSSLYEIQWFSAQVAKTSDELVEDSSTPFPKKTGWEFPSRKGEWRQRGFHHQKLMQGNTGWHYYCPRFLTRYHQHTIRNPKGRMNAKKFRCEIFISITVHRLGRNTSWTG